MAQIRLRTPECARGYLPLVCARCGKLARESKPVTFTMLPGWTHLFIFLAFIPWIIAAYTLRRTQTVDLPFCTKHAYTRGPRFVLMTFMIPVIVLLIVSVVAVPLIFMGSSFVSGWGICTMPVLLFGCIIVVSLVNRGGLRALKIDDGGITIKGVDPIFVDVVQELRQNDDDW